jgi:hypothetical protein
MLRVNNIGNILPGGADFDRVSPGASSASTPREAAARPTAKGRIPHGISTVENDLREGVSPRGRRGVGPEPELGTFNPNGPRNETLVGDNILKVIIGYVFQSVPLRNEGRGELERSAIKFELGLIQKLKFILSEIQRVETIENFTGYQRFDQLELSFPGDTRTSPEGDEVPHSRVT